MTVEEGKNEKAVKKNNDKTAKKDKGNQLGSKGKDKSIADFNTREFKCQCGQKLTGVRSLAGHRKKCKLNLCKDTHTAEDIDTM